MDERRLGPQWHSMSHRRLEVKGAWQCIQPFARATFGHNWRQGRSKGYHRQSQLLRILERVREDSIRLRLKFYKEVYREVYRESMWG